MRRKEEIGKKYHFTDTVSFPMDVTYPVYRNEMPDLVEFLPNITKILVLEREEVKGGVKSKLQWFAKVKLPGAASRLIPPDKINWMDTAEWDDEEHAVQYELSLPDLVDSGRVVGRNTFFDEGDRTRIDLDGEILIDIEKIKLAPKILLRRIVPTIEAFAVRLTKPNFMELNRGVEQYLKGKK